MTRRRRPDLVYVRSGSQVRRGVDEHNQGVAGIDECQLTGDENPFALGCAPGVAPSLAVGDRVALRAVVARGHVLEVVGDQVLVAWEGYGRSPQWLDAAALVRLQRRGA
jgi:hypothetical protein